jgi:hypothetical protein
MTDEGVQIIPESAKKLFRQLLDKRQEADAADKRAKKLKGEVKDLEAEVHDALLEAVGDPTTGKVSALPVDLGPPYGRVRLLPTSTIYGNVLNPDKLMEYLENSAQVDEYTRPELAKGELNALARRLLEENASFPPGFDYRTQRGVRVTIQK